MKRKKSKSRQNTQILLPSSIRKILLPGVLWLAVVFLTASPRMLDFRNSYFFIIGIKLLTGAAIVYFAFFHKSAKDLPVWGKACMLLGVLLLFSVFLSEKTSIVMSVVILSLQAVFFILTITKMCNPLGPGLVLMLTMLKLLSSDSEGWAFVNSPGGIHFWPFALVAMAAVGFAFYEMLRRDFIKLKDDRISERVAAVLLAGMAAFLGVWCSLCNLNYALDPSAPKTYATVVVDKHISSGKSTTYYLKTQTLEGELDFRVYEQRYYEAEVGDRGELLKYQGAFGDPYYVLKLDNIE